MYDPNAPFTKREQVLLDIICAIVSNPNIQIGSTGIAAMAYSYLQEFEEKAGEL